MREVVIGSRGSLLALSQTRLVVEQLLRKDGTRQIRTEIIRTTGDRISAGSLSGLDNTKAWFVKEIEEALLGGKIDLAVHSLKDLPGQLPDGLSIQSIPGREDPRDALVSDHDISSADGLPPGPRLATGSLRRQVQLRLLRPDASIEPIRGNVDTRLRKLTERGLDGLVLAAAGLERIGRADRINYRFPIEEMVPAVGQGALAIEVRSDDPDMRKLVASIDHQPSRLCVNAERAFLLEMGGSCQIPMGAHAWTEKNQGCFTAFVAHPSGNEWLRRTRLGESHELARLALETAEEMLSQGAHRLLEACQEGST